MIHIGIDTSNYKTSIAAVDYEGRIIANISEYLDVPAGKRGLRQSDAFFKHSNRLPALIESLCESIDTKDIASIGASYAPRRIEGSYMPCFLAGVNLGKVLSHSIHVPYYEFSHQEGHAAAIIETSEYPYCDTSLLMHLSGGTTEFLKCRPDDMGYETEIVGGSLDISFGQLIDRFGVALGLSFPAGAEIDEMAINHNGETQTQILPVIKLKDGYFNLSGPETRLLGHLQAGDIKDVEAASYELLDKIAEILAESSEYLCNKYRISKVYMAGGVASSQTIRNILGSRASSVDYQIFFGDPRLSGDNAVGIALLARKSYNRNRI